MANNRQIKPSAELLTSAIISSTSKLHSEDKINHKHLTLVLMRQNPEWKLSERRVTKYVKRMRKLQKKESFKSSTSTEVRDEEDDSSVGSSCVNSAAASNTSRSAAPSSKKETKRGNSLRLTLSTKKADKGANAIPPNKPNSTPESREPEMHVEAPPEKANETNFLPELHDDFLSEDELEAATLDTIPTLTTAACSGSDLKDEEELEESETENKHNESIEEGVQEMLAFTNRELHSEESSKLVGMEFLPEIEVDSSETPQQTKYETKEAENEIYKDDNDGKKEGAVCEGCVIL